MSHFFSEMYLIEYSIIFVLFIPLTINFHLKYVQKLNSKQISMRNVLKSVDFSLDNRPSNSPSGDYDFSQWSKAFRSQLTEYEYDIVEEAIEGHIPESLVGVTLYRNMPARFERGGKDYGHYLDGDGYVIRISFNSTNKVEFLSRFVQTMEYKQESLAGEILFRSSFRTQRPSNIILDSVCLNNAFDLSIKNLANTNILFWNNKLYALFEVGVPYELDPRTLATLGPRDFDVSYLRQGLSVKLPSLYEISPSIHDCIFGASMTAHPKVANGRLLSWIWRAKVDSSDPLKNSPEINIFEWNKDGKIVRKNTHILDDTTVAPHDFSVSNNYYAFVQNRVSGDVLPYILGKITAAASVDIESSNPMILDLVSRSGGKFMKISLEQPGFTIHSVCAFESQNGRFFELFTTGWCTETVASGKVKGGLLGSWEGTAPLFDDIPCTYLYHTQVDLSSGSLISHKVYNGMENVIVEHPHINPSYEGLPVRYLFMSVGSMEGKSSPPLGYLRLDLHSGEKQVWYAPLHTYCEEIVVVPKSRKDDDGQNEDDVWLLGSVFDAVKNLSSLIILDGKNVQGGPIARLWYNHQLPHSLHGNFVDFRSSSY